MTFSKIINSAANVEMKALAKLLDSARERRKQNLLVLEGFHLLQSAMDAACQIQSVYLNDAAILHPEWQSLQPALADKTRLVSAGTLGKVTSLATPGEILALCHRPEAVASTAAAAIMLDGIQDPGNMGTILRSAAAANVRQIFLSRHCVDVYSPKVLRSAMGAHFALEIHENVDLPAMIAERPGQCIATSLEKSLSLYELDLRGDVAFVFGNEGQGVSPEVLAACSHRVRIPMPGQAESLNVAMAATVCLFERVRQIQGN